MYATTHHKPSSLTDAVSALSGAEDGKLLAGGQTLIPTMKQHLAAPSDVVDLGGLSDLKGISLSGDTLSIGAMTTHAEVAASADVAGFCHALTVLAGGIGDPAVRARGTIGGSLANNDPAACYPSAVLGLGATVVTDSREIAADAYFTGLFETALGEDEVITAIRFPRPESAGYMKFKNPASRYAMVGVFVARIGGSVRVAVTGAGEAGVFRHAGLEAALSAAYTPDAVDGVAVSAEGLLSDMHASADYRAHLIKVMAGRAVTA